MSLGPAPFLLHEPIGALWLCAKVTLLLALVSVAVARSPRLSDAARHRLWTFGLAGALALVLLTPIVPRVRFDVGRRSGTGSVVVQPHAIPPEVLIVRPSHASGPSLSSTALEVLGWMSTLWLAGVVAMLLRLGCSQLLLLRLARKARAASAELRSGWERARGPETRARVLISDKIAAPITWGSLRPLILLPAAAERWPAARIRSVLAHESAHVRRLDHFAQSLGRITCALFWFHPLAWVALRGMRATSERAADDRALRSGVPANEYAAHLIAVARRSWRHPDISGGVGMARRTEFEQRIVAILEASRRLAPDPRPRTGLVLAYGAALVALAAIRVHIG